MTNIKEAIDKLIAYFKNNKDLNKISAAGGSKLYNDTSDYSELNVKSFNVRENTTFTTLTGYDENGNVKNFLTEFNISGKTLILGDLFIVPNGWKITFIKLGSGSIIAYS